MTALGDVLREVRHDARLSAEEAGARAGLCKSTIVYYESGDRTPTIDRLYQLGAAYEIDPRVLISVIERRCQMESAS